VVAALSPWLSFATPILLSGIPSTSPSGSSAASLVAHQFSMSYRMGT